MTATPSVGERIAAKYFPGLDGNAALLANQIDAAIRESNAELLAALEIIALGRMKGGRYDGELCSASELQNMAVKALAQHRGEGEAV